MVLAMKLLASFEQLGMRALVAMTSIAERPQQQRNSTAIHKEIRISFGIFDGEMKGYGSYKSRLL